jgi:hypothetical protein
MAITPTNSLFTALSGVGIDGTRPTRPAPDAARPPHPPAPAAAQPQTSNTSAPEPSRPLPRGSLVNIVV